MNTAFRDRVKATLDAACLTEKNQVCLEAWSPARSTTQKVLVCWQCHKNDALAAEIAELLEVSK